MMEKMRIFAELTFHKPKALKLFVALDEKFYIFRDIHDFSNDKNKTSKINKVTKYVGDLLNFYKNLSKYFPIL